VGRILEHTRDGANHTFAFDGNATIVVRDLKRNHLGQIWATVEASVGGRVVSAAQLNLLDNRRRIDFCADAKERQENIDWKACLLSVIEPLRQALDDATTPAPATPEAVPPPWKSGKDLMRRQFTQVREVVPGILPVGVTILASPPKLGKSRFMLNIALAVATGGKALGAIDVEPGDVLYLCLEDSEQLLQERLLDMLQGEEMPENFDYASEWRRFDEGGIEDIARWLESHPKAKLVVVDIFQRVKPIGKGNRNAYELDYAASSQILDIGNKHLGVSITVVHHVNRSKHVSDPMDLINGSNGILGGADGGMVMRAVPGQKGQATLEIAHRRLKVPPPTLALKTDPRTGAWILQGDAHQALVSEERQRVMDLIRQSGQPLSCRVIASELGKTVDAVRKCVQRMVRSGHLVVAAKGLYDLPPVTNTPVPGVLGVPDVPGVLGVLGVSGQEWDRGGRRGCPSLTADGEMENARLGQPGQGGHRFTAEPVHHTAEDSAELFDAVDVTRIDDEAPDDMPLTSHDPTADSSPAAQEAGFTRRIQQLAGTVSPTPSASSAFDAPPPLDEASTEARGEPVGGDGLLAAPARVSRPKAAGPTKAPWLFGNWRLITPPPSGEQPPVAEASDDPRGTPRDHHHDYEEHTL
jgi:biotin operon repressor